MQQVRLFKSVETEIREFEREVNGWMADVQQKGGTIIDVKGGIAPQTVSGERKSTSGFSPSDLFLFVIYEPAP